MSAVNSPLDLPSAKSTTNVLSKRLGSLQAFQSRIAARIAQAESSTQQNAVLLSLQVGAYRLAMPLLEVNELLDPPERTRLPLAKRWVLGLSVVRSEVLTVFDLAFCLSEVLDDSLIDGGFKSQQTMPFKNADGKLVLVSKLVARQVAFVADKVLGTVDPEQAGWSRVPLNGSSTQLSPATGVKALWRSEAGEMHIELSLQEWFQSADFANIAHAAT
jgi:chemotaxis signal transduction protein